MIGTKVTLAVLAINVLACTHGRWHHRSSEEDSREHSGEKFHGAWNNHWQRDHHMRSSNEVTTSREHTTQKSSFNSRSISTARKEGNSHRSFNNNKRICERKYAEYIKRIFPDDAETEADANDSDFDGRTLAEPGEYPHMTAIGFETPNQPTDYKCGGSLISEHFVITAAHCTNITGQLPTKVRIGDLNLLVDESYLEPQIRNIKNIHNHPDYQANSYYNDIALLELETDVEFTEFVRPIRLWVQTNFPYTTAYAIGYGSTAFGKERTNRLTHLNMTIVPNDECNVKLPSMPEAENGIIDSQICAQDFKMNRDTCQGDSGGPLQLNLRGRRRRSRKHYHLIGITSYGLFCRSSNPSVYTRISSYLDWIERIVWNV